MRIAFITNTHNIHNGQYKANTFNSTNSTMPVNFKSDSFEKSDKAKLYEKIEHQQRKELYKVLAEIEKEKQNSDISLYTLESFNDRLENINNEYKKLNEMLSQSSGKNQSYNYEIIMQYMEARANMAADKGFNRIVGHDKLKGKLIETFCIGTILNDKLEKNDNIKEAKVPDIILFYGPTGTGKTTFARALGEEAQTYTAEPNWVELSAQNSPEKKLEIIKDLAQRAKENYNKSSDKKRTIIILNEVDTLIASPDIYTNPVKRAQQERIVKDFISLARDCAQNYKCTLFLTTNEPQRIDKRILDKNMSPAKIGLEPSPPEVLQEILKKKLSFFNVSIDTDEIMKKLLENKSSSEYSNSDIESLVDNVMRYYKKPSVDDFVEEIECGFEPGISKESMDNFNEFKISQKNNIDEEWRELS